MSEPSLAARGAHADRRPGAGGVVLAARGLGRTFAAGDVVALEDVSFDVADGEFISLVGPSGCGKSTLLRIVAGLIEKSTGTLRIRGDEQSGPRADMAMMFQQPKLLPWKTAIDNVILPRRLARTMERSTWNEAADLLALLDLQGFEHSYPAQLSGGMQQRVALARLLITGSNIFLMDEPFASLDEFTRERLNLELLRIQAETAATVMFVTHNITEAVFLADRVFVMTPRPGRLAGIIDVPFARPRQIALLKAQEFNDLAFEVRALLGENVE